MRVKSRDGEEKRIALTSGHIAIIGAEWRELPENLKNHAYAAGCVVEDEGDLKAVVDPVITIEKVKQAIKEMIESDEPGMFTKSGHPDRRVLNNKCEIVVPAKMLDTAWAQVQEEAQGE